MVRDYILEWLRIMLMACPAYVLYRLTHRLLCLVGEGRPVPEAGAEPEGRAAFIAREIALGVFLVFMTALLALTFRGELGNLEWSLQNAAQRLYTGQGINLVPFHTIRGYCGRYLWSGLFLVNVVGNIVMFVPWGFGLALLWRRNQRVWRIALFSLLLPIFIETVQLFTLRSVDVDDVLLNFLGGCLGGLLYAAARRICPGMGELAR